MSFYRRGLLIQVPGSFGKIQIRLTHHCRASFHLSNPKPGHTTGGSGRAGHGGAAERGEPGRVGRRRVCSRRTQPSLVPSRASKTTVLNTSSEAQTGEILCKPLEDQNPRLTTDLSAVYHRDERRSLFLAADLYTGAYLSNPKPGHTTGGSGRGARRGGGAGPGRMGRRQNSSPSRQASLEPPKASKTRLLNVSPEARTSEFLCKPKVRTKSPVDNRFVSGL